MNPHADSVQQPSYEQALLGWTRYEKARKLNVAQWAELHQRNLRGENFDDMIDALPATTQPAQQDTRTWGDAKRIITHTVGFGFEPGELQTVNQDDLLRLVEALAQQNTCVSCGKSRPFVCDYCGAPQMPKKVTDEMVNRFLGWRLPADFSPDCGIGFDGRGKDAMGYEKTWPIGTNLLTAEQARAMLEHVLATPPAEKQAAPSGEGEAS